MSEATSALVQCLAVAGAGLCVVLYVLSRSCQAWRAKGDAGAASFDVSVAGCGSRAVLVVIDAEKKTKVVTLGVEDASEDRDELLDDAAEAIRGERRKMAGGRE